MNLCELLEASARRSPDKLALIEDVVSMSYAELSAQVQDSGRKLSGCHIASGSRIGLAFPNGIAYVVWTYALWKLGAVVVPIPTECPPEEVAEISVAMQLSGLLTQKSQESNIAVTENCFFTRLNPTTLPDNHDLNLAFIRFTSGTTNARKGVALSHETILERIRSANKAFHISERDTVIWCLPMAHHFLITIVLYLEVGATIVLARHVTARPFLDAVNRHNGTILYAAPFHFAMLARDNSEAKIESVRLAVSTTCALPQTVAEDFFKRFNRPLAQALGVIELGLVALNTASQRVKWNSVGHVAGDFELRIHNPDAEGCGELAVRGPGICDAYVAPWVARADFLRDGWFFTGDIARLDADRFLFLLSRKSAVINLAGRKVFPEEIETVLNRHPSVKESRVFGKIHPHLGETVEAEIVLAAPDAKLDTMHAFCREHLASYKIPTRFTVVAVIARTPVTGKILRAVPTG
jgi:acyl-CoA synthetase (AMP-forming)/AMP-acid ligase II